MADAQARPAWGDRWSTGQSRGLAGVGVASSGLASAREAVEDLAAQLGSVGPGFLILFASSRYDPAGLVAALDVRFAGLAYAGCSTSGEIGLEGVMDSSIVAIHFPADDFQIVSTPMEALSEFGMETGQALVMDLRRRLPGPVPEDPAQIFALTLLDGLCRREELILSALQRALDDIPLVGGSSGDELTFDNTFVFQNGRVMRDAGLLLLIRSRQAFRLFKSDHFDPSARKLVVTACDPGTRIVSELDAEPAALAFAEAVGLDPRSLGAMSFAAHPLLVRVGGAYYCRSIQKLNDDGSLSFYCAIDTGVVLTVADTRDIVVSLEQTLVALEDELGDLEFVLGFDCIHRRLEAQSRQVLHRISDLFRRHRVVGFNTYGEQFNAMHLNHTFTGVAFARRGAEGGSDGRRPQALARSG